MNLNVSNRSDVKVVYARTGFRDLHVTFRLLIFCCFNFVISNSLNVMNAERGAAQILIRFQEELLKEVYSYYFADNNLFTSTDQYKCNI